MQQRRCGRSDMVFLHKSVAFDRSSTACLRANGHSNRIGSSDAVRHHEGSKSRRQRGPVRAVLIAHVSPDCKRNEFPRRYRRALRNRHRSLRRVIFSSRGYETTCVRFQVRHYMRCSGGGRSQSIVVEAEDAYLRLAPARALWISGTTR